MVFLIFIKYYIVVMFYLYVGYYNSFVEYLSYGIVYRLVLKV